MKILTLSSAVIIAGLSFNTFAAAPVAKHSTNMDATGTKSEMMSSKFKKVLTKKSPSQEKVPVSAPVKPVKQ